MKSALLTERCIPGRAMLPQNVNTTKINGDAIVNPWQKGKRLLFTIISGAFATGDSITFAIERRRIGTSTWDAVLQPDDSTALIFTVQTKAATAGTMAARLNDGLALYCELDLTDIRADKNIGTSSYAPANAPGYQYDALRLCATNGAAQNVVIGATYEIGDLWEEAPTSDAHWEDLFKKQRYTAGNVNLEP